MQLFLLLALNSAASYDSSDLQQITETEQDCYLNTCLNTNCIVLHKYQRYNKRPDHDNKESEIEYYNKLLILS